MALAVIERIMSSSGTVLLEVCRALWALQALKEKKSIQAIEKLDRTMLVELKKMEATLEARSVAAQNNPALESVNTNQREEFQATVSQQRQTLLTAIAWEMRTLLCLQQQILCKLAVPTFENGPTADSGALDLQARVCSYLHSAFYLRSRVGEEPHMKMLSVQVKTLEKELTEKGSGPPPMTNMSPLRGVAPPIAMPPQNPIYGGYPPQQQQQPMTAYNTGIPPMGYHPQQSQQPQYPPNQYY